MDRKDRKRGRPVTSNLVRVTPEFRPEPDIEKLGRALIAVAISIAEKKKAESQGNTVTETTNNTKIRIYPEGRKGDGMT